MFFLENAFDFFLRCNWYDNREDVGGIWQENDGIISKNDFFDFLPEHNDAIIFALTVNNVVVGKRQNECASFGML